MNTFEGGSGPEEDSQATQLLHSVLDPGDPSSGRNPHNSVQEDDPNISNASGPSLSRISNGHYHYHGLAATQTQTQPHHSGDYADVNEGSHKENINSNNSRGVGLREKPPTPFPPYPSSSKKTSQDNSHPNELKHSLLRVSKSSSIKNKTLSYKSPTKNSGKKSKPTPPAPTKTKYSSPEEAVELSQDSFAGDIYQDPAKQFLASSKQFDVPLTELDRVISFSGGTNDFSKRGDHSNSMNSYPGSSRRSKRSLSPSEGQILVESTPSLSSGSHSQAYEDSMMFGRQPDFMDLDVPADHSDNLSRHSTEEYISDAPSSSYLRHLEDREDDALPPVLELQATQPSTQVDDVNGVDVSPSPLALTTNPSDGTSHSAQSNSRNILAMVDPKKRWRYRQYENHMASLPRAHNSPPANNVSQQSSGAALEATQPSTDNWRTVPVRRLSGRVHHTGPDIRSPPRGLFPEETQPSFDDDRKLDRSQRQFLKRALPARPSPIINSESGPSYHRTQQDEHVDVVPDSEPLRADVAVPASGEKIPDGKPLYSTGPHGPKGRNDIVNSSDKDGSGTEGMFQSDNRRLRQSRLRDDNDEEQSVPLAAVVLNRHQKPSTEQAVDKGKARTVPDMSDKGRDPQAHQTSLIRGNTKNPLLTMQAPLPEAGASITTGHKTRSAVRSSGKPSGTGRSWETGEVPSSAPQQDLIKPIGNKRPRVTRKAAKRKAPTAGGHANVKRTRSSWQHSVDGEDDNSEELYLESDDELLKSDHGTEPGEQGYVEQEAAPYRKRKRGIPAVIAPTKTRSKVSSNAASTPVTRQTKRLRAIASASRGGSRDATRVFALWKQDGYWYPGVVYSQEDAIHYLVRFEDETDAPVTVDQMRLCELQVGDDVMVTNALIPRHHRSVMVVDVSKAKANLVSVRADGDIVEVPIKALKIAAKSISFAWRERTLPQSSIVTVVKPEQSRLSSTPSRLSIASGPSVRGTRRKILDKTALVVTISGGSDWGKERDSIMSAIKNNGGTVIDDWTNVIRLEGKHAQTNNRWVIQKSDVQWIGKDDVERVFLLADDASQKPKFLIALALGIPCLSVAWLHDSVESGEEKEWLAYLLPQGYSEALGARPSQQVNMDWGNTIHHLNDIMENKVASKLFDKLSVLCVGLDMVPQPRGKRHPGTDEKTQEALNAVTRIILSMGAERVEAVSELKYASAPVTEFDFVIVKESQHYNAELEEKAVHWTWVKDCLIASRRLPLPAWGPQNTESQDA